MSMQPRLETIRNCILLMVCSHDRRDDLPRDPLAPLRSCLPRYRTVRSIPQRPAKSMTDDASSAVILIIGLGIIATYTGYVIGQFKLAYPHVHNMADAGEVMAGRIGREIFGGAQILFLVFVMGSHILTFSIMMNTVTSHGTCTIVFGIVGMMVCIVFSLPRTLKKVSYMAIASFISILSAVMITMIGVGVERPGSGKVDVTVQSDLSKGFEAVTNIIFAYAGKTLPPLFLCLSPTNRGPRPRRILLLHLRTPHSRILPKSRFPPPRRRHLHVPNRRNRDLPLCRQRCRIPSSRLHFPSLTENSLRNRDPYHCVRFFGLQIPLFVIES